MDMGLIGRLRLFVRALFAPDASKRYPPLTIHQAWMASLAAPLLVWPDALHTRLYPYRRVNPSEPRLVLKMSWGVTNTQQAVQTCQQLLAAAQRDKVPAWHLVRAAYMARDGFAAGYIDQQTAWHLLYQAAQIARQHYNSWRGYAESYVQARVDWVKSQPDPDWADQKAREQIVAHLLDPANPASPWNTLAWDALNHPDAPWQTNEDVLTIKY